MRARRVWCVTISVAVCTAVDSVQYSDAYDNTSQDHLYISKVYKGSLWIYMYMFICCRTTQIFAKSMLV